MDATLRELTSLVREVNPDARKKGTYFEFSIISPAPGRGQLSQNGDYCHYISRDIGTTISGTKGMDDNKTLNQARFVIGDYIDIAISPPNPGGGGRGGGGPMHHRLDRMGGGGGGGGGRRHSRDRDHRDGGGGGRRWRGGNGAGGGGDRRRRPY